MSVQDIPVALPLSTIVMKKGVPIGLSLLLPSLPTLSPKTRNKAYRGLILLLTFLTYASFHLSRKAISVVKNAWNPSNCSTYLHLNASDIPNQLGGDYADDSLYDYDSGFSNGTISQNMSTLTWPTCGWKPFINSDLELALLDFTYLGSYAFFMFFMGHIGDRINLRYFLFLGMTASGVLTAALGLPLWLGIHSYAYFFIIQFLAGAAQSTGWPSTVAVMGHWFGKGNRGFIMGIWNAHTSVGNILGSAIAGVWVGPYDWAWAFVVPGSIICGVGLLVLLFLPVDPEAVGCNKPDHNDPNATSAEDTDDENQRLLTNEHRPLNRAVIVSHSDTDSVDNMPLASGDEPKPALKFVDALRIPGVIEFSLCLFFAKFVPYIFLYWLPVYIHDNKIGGKVISPEMSADLSTIFDAGGVIGGITAGVISDRGGTRGLTCVGMLVISIPLLWVFKAYGDASMGMFIFMMIITGFFVNGPYALITTAVSADLGNHDVLKGNQQAKATVAAIIDGTGSIGAALGPLITGIGLQKTKNWLLIIMICMGATLAAALLLIRVCIREIRRLRGYSS
eukprot:scpid35623/ scgid14689/ Putative glycerol-3-phosphate transporter 1; Glycerol-3-phosphate permease 1; Protein PHOSPHATE STARVATION-INDUCED GENE 3